MDDLGESVRNAERLSVSHTSFSTHLLISPENSNWFTEEDLPLQSGDNFEHCADTF